MSYVGRVNQKSSDIRRFDVTSSTSATHTLTWVAPNEQSLIVTINGVKQQEDAYSVSGTTLTLTDALIATDKLEVIGINDLGTTITPAQNSITNDMVSSTAAIATSKVSGAVTSIASNGLAASATTDTTNASNISSGTLGTARLGSGTASSSTFLRGDGTWNTAGVSTLGALTDVTVSASNPTVSTNPAATGYLWVNKTSGDTYVATDITSGANVWTNVGNGTTNIQPTYNVDFLVIAGGGGGGEGNNGRAGGGGAGGYRNSYASEASGGGGSSETPIAAGGGTVYTVTVGGGGAGSTSDSAKGSDGGDSSIAGSGLTTITSVGGGGGGSISDGDTLGRSGGSGGGTGYKSPYPNVIGGSGALGNPGGYGGSSDYPGPTPPTGGYMSANSGGGGGAGGAAPDIPIGAVSYTHLTLPTNREV